MWTSGSTDRISLAAERDMVEKDRQADRQARQASRHGVMLPPARQVRYGPGITAGIGSSTGNKPRGIISQSALVRRESGSLCGTDRQGKEGVLFCFSVHAEWGVPFRTSPSVWKWGAWAERQERNPESWNRLGHSAPGKLIGQDVAPSRGRRRYA